MGSTCLGEIAASFLISQLLISGTGSLEPLSMMATRSFD